MSAAKILLTAEEFDNYPFEEDKRYELDEGELIEMTKPAYRHNRVLIRLTYAVMKFFEANPIGEALNSENLFALSPQTRLAPDLAIFLGDRSKELENAKVISIVPGIVVEVLSPSERPGRIHRKLKQYFDGGVKEVWMVDPEDRIVEIWTGVRLPDREFTITDSLSSTLLPRFQLSLEELFS